MRSYKIFIILGFLLLIFYTIAEVNQPTPTDWSVSFSNTKKNPYGSYILFHELKNIFPSADISSYREPLYNKLHKNQFNNAALFLISSSVMPTELEVEEMLDYVNNGNYIFIAAPDFSKKLLDTLRLKIKTSYFLNKNDSVFNFVNPLLKNEKGYDNSNSYFYKNYFDILKKDSVIVLGVNANQQPNFIKINIGDGAFFIHTDPFCFTNYFMLQKNNNEYTQIALSYLPSRLTTILWDEYYKLGREGAGTPLRFFLSNTYLRWVLWLSVTGLLLFVFFEMKRKQRIIPVIVPLKNTTLDFVKTVANVYFNQKDNAGIANKKMKHWMEFVRQRFYILTQQLDDDFVDQLSKKSGVDKNEIQKIIDYHLYIQQNSVSDSLLMHVNNSIDKFYNQSK